MKIKNLQSGLTKSFPESSLSSCVVADYLNILGSLVLICFFVWFIVSGRTLMTMPLLHQLFHRCLMLFHVIASRAFRFYFGFLSSTSLACVAPCQFCLEKCFFRPSFFGSYMSSSVLVIYVFFMSTSRLTRLCKPSFVASCSILA